MPTVTAVLGNVSGGSFSGDATSIDGSPVDAPTPGTGNVLAFDGANWVDSVPTGGSGSGFDFEGGRRVGWGYGVGGAAAILYAGAPAFTGTGGTATSTDDAIGPLVRLPTGTTSGNSSHQVTTALTCFRRDHESEMLFVMATDSDISSIRIWVGFFSAAPDATSTPTGHFAAFRYDTGADGTAFWSCHSRDGTTTESTTTTAAIAVSTRYNLKIVLGASDVVFSVNGSTVATHATNIPGASTPMGINVGTTTLTNAARAIKYGYLVMSHNV